MGVNLLDDEGPRGGGDVLPEGWHNVQVRSFKECKANSGSPGVEYLMGNASGTIKRTFWITPRAKYILKNFVGCCGYEGDLRNFDFKAILGASVKVLVGLGDPKKQGKRYMDVLDFAPIDGRRQVHVNSAGNVADEEDAPF